MIEVRQLTKRFGMATAVDGVTFNLVSGELLALVGGSGSGKTTTLKMLNRLIEPSSGHVYIDGQDIQDQPAYMLRRSIGYVFQRIGLFAHMTVEENIGVTPRLLGWAPDIIRERVRELLELVGLEGSIECRFPSALSGGQQQRVAVARALAARPRLVLFDEPFGALDPITRDKLQQSFRRIRTGLGMTAVFVTHDMAEALALADRVAVLAGGRLVQLATPGELLAHPADEYVQQLMDTPRRQARIFDDLARGAGNA